MQVLKTDFIQSDFENNGAEEERTAMLLLHLIGLQYLLIDGGSHGNEESHDTSLVQQQFLKKLFSLNVNTLHTAHDGDHDEKEKTAGKYDGIILSLYHVNKHGGHCNIAPEETVLKITCDLLSCFGDDAFGEEDPENFFKWNLLSREAVFVVLELLNDVFTKTPNALYTQIPEAQIPTILYTISQMLKLDHKQLVSRFNNNKLGGGFVSSNEVEKKKRLEKNLVKILCLPFAIEMDETTCYEILCSLHQSDTLSSLFEHVQRLVVDRADDNRYCDDEGLGMTIGLIARLVLTDEMFVAQLKSLLKRDDIGDIFREFLYAGRDSGRDNNIDNNGNHEIQCDMLAVLSHLARQSVDSVADVSKTLCTGGGTNVYIC